MPMTLMDLGTWLLQQRQARGWSRREMARRLIKAGRACGDTAMPHLDSMYRNVHRWEAGQTSPLERFALYYCHAFGIPAGQFGIAPLPSPASGNETAPAPPESAATPPPAPATAAGGPGQFSTACHQIDGPNMTRFMVEREILTAAHDGSDHAGQYEQSRTGEATLEQLRADLSRLAHLSGTGEPLAVFWDLRRVRDRSCRALDRRPWPREQADLHLLLGALNGLMGTAAARLGYPDAAEELIRAGRAYADAIGHQPLKGQLRAQMSALMYWHGQYGQARDLAADGLGYTRAGWPAGALHLHLARAAARLGDAEQARQAIGAAHQARENDYTDDLVQMGGQFALSRATHHALAGAALAGVAGAEAEAARELEQAIGLYEDGPDEGEQHWFAGQALAGLDLAMVRLRSGALDAAAAALAPALSLPSAQRVTQVSTRLDAVRDELAAPIYRGAAQARDLRAQIEEFGRHAILTALHDGHN